LAFVNSASLPHGLLNPARRIPSASAVKLEVIGFSPADL
jgi:hypothetical protein